MKRAFTAFIVFLLAAIAFFVWWKISLSPVNSRDSNSRPFAIVKGDGVREVAKKLHDEGLIRDQIAFFLLIKFRLGIDKNIQAGDFQLSPAMSAQELAQKLTVGTEDLWITVPEGWRNEEIVDFLKTKGFSVKFGLFGNVVNASQGYLFPDTYLVPKQSTVEQIFDLMRKNFDKKVTFPVTKEQLIMASLIEREAKTEADRPLVASVLKNRLDIGMALNVDASVQYAIGYTTFEKRWWKKELTIDDLKFKSPYNTYLNSGLPPAPICNPGLSTIKAASNPAQTDYLYYLSDKNGDMHYAKTLEEHNTNVATYLR